MLWCFRSRPMAEMALSKLKSGLQVSSGSLPRKHYHPLRLRRSHGPKSSYDQSGYRSRRYRNHRGNSKVLEPPRFRAIRVLQPVSPTFQAPTVTISSRSYTPFSFSLYANVSFLRGEISFNCLQQTSLSMDPMPAGRSRKAQDERYERHQLRSRHRRVHTGIQATDRLG